MLDKFMFYYHFKISNDNCTTLHLAFCWHATHPSTPPTLSPRAQIFCAHSPKFVNQFNVNEPCRDGLAFGTPKNRLWKSGSVKLCKKTICLSNLFKICVSVKRNQQQQQGAVSFRSCFHLKIP